MNSNEQWEEETFLEEPEPEYPSETETTPKDVDEKPNKKEEKEGVPPWMILLLVAVIGIILYSFLAPDGNTETEPDTIPSNPTRYDNDILNSEVPLPPMPLSNEDLTAATKVAKDVTLILANGRIDGTEMNRQIGDKAVADLVVQPKLIAPKENYPIPSLYTPIVTQMTEKSMQVSVPTTLDTFMYEMWKEDDGRWVVVEATSKECQRTMFCGLDYQEGGPPPEGFEAEEQ